MANVATDKGAPDTNATAAPSTDGSAFAPAQPLPELLLYRRCTAADLPFALSSELEEAPGLIGQERAVEAISLAMRMHRKGYNVYALGPSGTGRHSLIEELLRKQAESEPTPPDWCYVNNFADPQKPRRLRLPAGRGVGLAAAMKRLIEELRTALPAAFEHEEYRAQRAMIEQEFKGRHEQAFGAVQARAETSGIALLRTEAGLAMAPKRDGKVLSPEQLAELSPAEREHIQHEITAIREELAAMMQQVPQWDREHRDTVRALDRETTSIGIAGLTDELRTSYRELPEVLGYLDAVVRDVKENAADFLPRAVPQPPNAATPATHTATLEEDRFRRYQVKVIIDNGGRKGAPVVYEDNPTHQTLVGRVERIARFGALITDFNLLAPGALHHANGGYLILDASKLLGGNYGWASLKRALNAGEIRIETLEQLLSQATTVSLEPEPIPLDIKVVLIGPPAPYYMLSAYDEEFPDLFKTAADFDDRMVRTSETVLLYARFIAALARREQLRALDRDGVARIVEYASRLAGDGGQISIELRAIADVLREADQLAADARREIIGAAEIQAAIDAKFRRGDRIYRRLLDEIAKKSTRVETDGVAIGQVNGLFVTAFGGASFGVPSRITARVRLGRGEVVDIEREVALGGPLHSKGVLILAGFLGGHFGLNRPLSLHASLVFEQSYGGVDGDSASAAELFALLSALAAAPITQALAVTGSVDQRGQIQTIGGVNEKIEGFFDACRGVGLTGKQGVVIPAANVRHLMLRQDVVTAAAEGRFAIYPIDTVDQGIELLTGLSAGQPDTAGVYPPDTIYRRVADRLDAFAARVAELLRQAAAVEARL
ncbi:MAG: Lon protease family protein [Alphaproteobacteria bacterium]